MHQPMRYWPGPPPFLPYSANWSGGGGGFAGAGATGTFSSGAFAPFNNSEQVTTLAEGLICIGSADGRLIPLLPFANGGAAPMSGEVSPLARGLICVLSNGKVVSAGQNSNIGAFSNGQAAPAGAACVIWSTDGKIIPMNMCGG